MLRVQDLCMYFGGVHAVDGLSFDVKKGEIFGLIGPNGAGKTTVFNCITQFYKPTSGTLLFENKAGEVISLPEEKVHDVVLQGIVRTFQNVEVIREVSVLDNLLIAGASAVYGRDFVSGSTPADAEEAGAHYKGEGPPCAGIHGPYGVQRLVCRRPALRDPEENRDRTHTDVRPPADYIGRACRGSERHRDFGAGGADSPHPGYHGCTILLVEHDMGLVMNICQTVCAISFGKLLAIGTPEEIQKDPQVQKAYLGESDEEVEK